MAQTGLLLVPSDALGHTWALPGALGGGLGLPPPTGPRDLKSRIRAASALSSIFLPRTARPAPLRDARRRSTIKLLYGSGIASPGLARLRDIVHMVSLYNILTDTPPSRARPGPPRPSSASGGPPAAARCGGVTNPTAEHRETRSGDLRPSEAYALPIQGYHLDLSTGACGAVVRSCCSRRSTLSERELSLSLS